ncbi:MAG: hypothetical protein ACKOUK_09585, partial [Verrucomicrobiota bacterium]
MTLVTGVGFPGGIEDVVDVAPALEWTLPGPWQASQPISLRASPGVISFAWVAEPKLRVMSSWHWAQSLAPTKLAPGTLGGIRTVRFTITQETSRRPHAAVPPNTRALREGKGRIFITCGRRETRRGRGAAGAGPLYA